jgi:hypothetical protein
MAFRFSEAEIFSSAALIVMYSSSGCDGSFISDFHVLAHSEKRGENK